MLIQTEERRELYAAALKSKLAAKKVEDLIQRNLDNYMEDDNPHRQLANTLEERVIPSMQSYLTQFYDSVADRDNAEEITTLHRIVSILRRL